MLTPQWLDELRARITLSAIVGRTVRLTKAGREFKACCPFHNEKTPSFYVNDEKGFYHCFGCEAHGDAIRWMTDQQGLPFMDAVKELAAEAGMEVPAPDPRAARQAEKRASLHDVTAAAQAFYVDRLRSADGATARAYLARRGFSQGVVEAFGFGFAPEERQAIPRALAQFDEPMLLETGLRIDVEGKEPYDRFRGRLMLPIQDARGRVIGFGGRILDGDSNSNAPKYLNSPDTPLFDKGRTLYNLHRAAPAARKSGRMIVVEGYMDAIALAQAGFEEAVAPLGTALTETQIEMLWRHVERPILCFDGDKAGQKAAMRAIDRALPLLRPGRSIALALLPGGLDPDDYIRKVGPDSFAQIVERPTDLINAIWDFEYASVDLESPDSKALFRERLIETALKIEDKELRRLYRSTLIDKYYKLLRPRFDAAGRAEKHGLLSPDNLRRLSHIIHHGQRETLLNAVVGCLARRPKLIDEFYDLLLDYEPIDEQLQFALDVFVAVLQAELEGDDLPEDTLHDLATGPFPIPFRFLRRDLSDDEVRPLLHEAIVILIEKPRVQRGLDAATARYGETLSEEDRLEQTAWRTRKLDLDARVKGFAKVNL